MYYVALATDYDGTLATDSRVDAATLAALERLRESGRRLVLVTGRQVDDLGRIFPDLGLFDRVVAENGALLYRPDQRQEVALARPPPESFLSELRNRGVEPLSVGRVIVATREPHQATVLEAIRALGLEMQIIFNKGAVMALPGGVNKASGFAAALREMALSPHNVVGVGDAENDHAFLKLCGCAVAVANALDTVKTEADLVTEESCGAGVGELIGRMLANDLADLRIPRHWIRLGTGPDGQERSLAPRGSNVLLAGPSGGGKSTLATSFLERLAEHGYQFCIVDPEGDYETFDGAIVLGDARQPPEIGRLADLLMRPDRNLIVNLLGVAPAERPRFFADLLLELQQARARTARPHWIVVDEAHHVLPAVPSPAASSIPEGLTRLFLITVHPDRVLPAVVKSVDTLIAVGDSADETVGAFCAAAGLAAPVVSEPHLPPGEALLWQVDAGSPPETIRADPPAGERKRHLRKYAEGRLGEDKSFYFRGPDGALNLRAYNLEMFSQIAAGVDDATWLHHLRTHDYSRWFRDSIKDGELAERVAAVESRADLDPAESRALIRRAIEERYTGPA